MGCVCACARVYARNLCGLQRPLIAAQLSSPGIIILAGKKTRSEHLFRSLDQNSHTDFIIFVCICIIHRKTIAQYLMISFQQPLTRQSRICLECCYSFVPWQYYQRGIYISLSKKTKKKFTNKKKNNFYYLVLCILIHYYYFLVCLIGVLSVNQRQQELLFLLEVFIYLFFFYINCCVTETTTTIKRWRRKVSSLICALLFFF